MLLLACGSETSQPGEAEFRFVSASSGLRMRSEPNTESTRLGLLPQGTRVEILEESAPVTIDNIEAPWVRVRHGAVEGWVFGGYLGQEREVSPGVRPEKDAQYVGVWQGENLCDGERSRIAVNEDGSFEARLFGGCDVSGCDCVQIAGTWRIREEQVCFEWQYEDSEASLPEVCYRRGAAGRLNAAAESGFPENYNSEVLTNLERRPESNESADSKEPAANNQ